VGGGVDVSVAVAVGWGVAVDRLKILPPSPMHALLANGMMIIKTSGMVSDRCRLMNMGKIIPEFKTGKQKQAARTQPVDSTKMV